MTEVHNGAKYQTIVTDDGKQLQAVFRLQEAQSEKTCEFEDCVLGKRILPLETYARVFYEDTNEVEIYHFACFGKAFDVNPRF